MIGSAEDWQMSWCGKEEMGDEKLDAVRLVLVFIEGIRRRPGHVRSRVICWILDEQREVGKPKREREIHTGFEWFSRESVLIVRITV